MELIRRDYYKQRFRMSINPNIPNQVFADEWLTCTLNPKRPTDKLFKYLELEIERWVHLLTPGTNKDLAWCMLVEFLGWEAQPLELLDLFYRENKEDLYTIVASVFLVMIRKPGIKIECRPDTLCFLLTRMFVNRLAHLIRAWGRRNKRIYETTDTDGILWTDASEDLRDLMRDISSNPYGYYLCSLYLLGYDRNEFESITRTTTSFVYFWRFINDTIRKRETT